MTACAGARNAGLWNGGPVDRRAQQDFLGDAAQHSIAEAATPARGGNDEIVARFPPRRRSRDQSSNHWI